MRRQDLVKYQILGAVRSAAAKSEGDTELPLYRTTKLQLAAMTDEELRDLARMIAHRIGGSVDLIYGGFKRSIQKHKTTVKWRVRDL